MSYESWTIGDFLSHFEREIERAKEQRFKDVFRTLTAELSLLDAEFLKEKKGCGEPLEVLLDRLHSLAGRLGYCERPRGYEAECEALYGDVDDTVRSVRQFRQSCSE